MRADHRIRNRAQAGNCEKNRECCRGCPYREQNVTVEFNMPVTAGEIDAFIKSPLPAYSDWRTLATVTLGLQLWAKDNLIRPEDTLIRR